MSLRSANFSAWPPHGQEGELARSLDKSQARGTKVAEGAAKPKEPKVEAAPAAEPDLTFPLLGK